MQPTERSSAAVLKLVGGMELLPIGMPGTLWFHLVLETSVVLPGEQLPASRELSLDLMKEHLTISLRAGRSK